MTVSIANLAATWIDSNAKIGIGINVVDLAGNTSSRLLKLSSSSNSKFSVDVTGKVDANVFAGNTFTGTTFSGTTGTLTTVVSTTVNTAIAITRPYTVSTLPTSTIGSRSFVTDATLSFASANLGTVVVGGGTNKVPVYANGTHWLIG